MKKRIRAGIPYRYKGQSSLIYGLLTFLFYYQGKYTEIDSLMVVLAAYVGVVDCVQPWRVGQPGRGLFRLVASWGFVACGMAGLTASSLART